MQRVSWGRMGSASAIAVILGASAGAFAQNQSSKEPEAAKPAQAAPAALKQQVLPPDTAPPPDAPVMIAVPISVEEVAGDVLHRPTPESPWIITKAGDRIEQGATFRVGLNSHAHLLIAGVQAITFDHVGRYIIHRAYNDGTRNVTRIAIPKEGRVTFNVNSTQIANDLRIEAPDMTLAITGTVGGIEVTPGFPTSGMGDIRNTGEIVLDYLDGHKVRLVHDDRSDSRTADPAAQLNVAAAARNSGIRTQEDSEKEAAARSTGGADSVKLSLDLKTISSTFSKVDMATFMHPGPVPTADTTFHFDSVTGDLFETGPNLVSTRFESGLNVDPQASDGGAALLTSLVDGSQSLIRLETTTPLASVVKNTFLSLDLQKPSEGLRVIGKVQGPSDQVPTLSGLGAIRDRLYASGTLNDRSGIYRVDLATNSFTPVMSPGIRLEGALAGSSERGSLFVFGHEPGTETAGGSPFSHGVILELDPRTNYLVAAYSANNGAFSQVPGTINPSRIDLEHTQAITGMSYVNGMIIMSAAVGSTGTGQTVLVEYNPAAANSPGHPAIERIMPAPEAFTTGLASETTARPPPSVPLANPPGRIDTLTINALFAQLAYSPKAFNSGIVERSVRAEVIRTARDPAGCASSGEIANLRSLLASHVNQTAGVGRAVAEFRDSLPMMHPCMH